MERNKTHSNDQCWQTLGGRGGTPGGGLLQGGWRGGYTGRGQLGARGGRARCAGGGLGG